MIKQSTNIISIKSNTNTLMRFILFAAVVCISVMTSTQASTLDVQSSAQNELRLMNIPFNADNFVLYAGRGDLKVVQLFLQGGMSANATESKYGAPPIHYASAQGFQAVVEELINNGADVNQQNNEGRTALIAPAYYGYKDTVKYLLDNGANPNHLPKVGPTALVAAIQNGKQDIVELLISRGANVDLADINNTTPLIAASYGGRTELLNFILQKGANVNHRNNAGDTALIAAVRNNHVNAAKILVTHKCDTKAKDANGMTAIDITKKMKFAKIAALLH